MEPQMFSVGHQSRTPGGQQTADYGFHCLKAKGDFHPSSMQRVSSSSLHPGSTFLFSCLTLLCLMDGSPLIVSLRVILFKPEGGLAALSLERPQETFQYICKGVSLEVFCPTRCSCSIPYEQMELLPNWNELMSFALVLTLNLPRDWEISPGFISQHSASSLLSAFGDGVFTLPRGSVTSRRMKSRRPAKAPQGEFELDCEGLLGFCQVEKTRRKILVMGEGNIRMWTKARHFKKRDIKDCNSGTREEGLMSRRHYQSKNEEVGALDWVSVEGVQEVGRGTGVIVDTQVVTLMKLSPPIKPNFNEM